MLDKIFGGGKREHPKQQKHFTNFDFWNWFVENANRFYDIINSNNDISGNFINPVSIKLNQLRSGYFILTGMYVDGIAELIITADGDVRTIPFIEKLVADAPDIPKWRITALKPPSEREDFEVSFSHATLSAETLHFVFKEEKDYPDLINIEIVHKDITDATKRLFHQGIFIFLDNYIGELQCLELIDDIEIKPTHLATGELIPLSKLDSFLKWRRKEFVEKYDSIMRTSDDDQYTGYESITKEGKTLIATINSDLLQWEHTSAYPWIVVIRLAYKSQNNGMPSENQNTELYELEESINKVLNEDAYCLNIGRETGDNLREIYYACKDFRYPAISLDGISDTSVVYKMDYQISKDKYWRVFDRFRRSSEL